MGSGRWRRARRGAAASGAAAAASCPRATPISSWRSSAKSSASSGSPCWLRSTRCSAGGVCAARCVPGRLHGARSRSASRSPRRAGLRHRERRARPAAALGRRHAVSELRALGHARQLPGARDRRSAIGRRAGPARPQLRPPLRVLGWCWRSLAGAVLGARGWVQLVQGRCRRDGGEPDRAERRRLPLRVQPAAARGARLIERGTYLRSQRPAAGDQQAGRDRARSTRRVPRGAALDSGAVRRRRALLSARRRGVPRAGRLDDAGQLGRARTASYVERDATSG